MFNTNNNKEQQEKIKQLQKVMRETIEELKAVEVNLNIMLQQAMMNSNKLLEDCLVEKILQVRELQTKTQAALLNINYNFM